MNRLNGKNVFCFLKRDKMLSALIVFSVLATAWSKSVPCPKVKGVTDIDKDQFARVWYDVQIIPSFYLKDTKCSRFRFTATGNDNYDIVHTVMDTNTNKTKSFSGKMKFLEDKPGHILYDVPYVLPNRTYTLLEVDEDSYFVAYSCKDEFIYLDQDLCIASRHPGMTQKKLDGIKKRLRDMNVTAGFFLRPVDHTNCPDV